MNRVPYTVIVDYLGGTYVSQFRCSSAFEAAQRWTRSAYVLREFGAHAFVLSAPVSLKRTKSVWCISGTSIATGKLILMNVVKTDPS
jgi:hypothetical protein